MSVELPKTLEFKLPATFQLWLGGYVVLAIVLIWQSCLPFFAERHYRDGYNFEVEGRLKYAIEEYEIAIQDAPWETQYMMDLAKVYGDFAAQQATVKNYHIL